MFLQKRMLQFPLDLRGFGIKSVFDPIVINGKLVINRYKYRIWIERIIELLRLEKDH